MGYNEAWVRVCTPREGVTRRPEPVMMRMWGANWYDDGVLDDNHNCSVLC
jgi:hypothetical protein